jgi:prepilin-type processing-associated H-X9-DG protein
VSRPAETVFIVDGWPVKDEPSEGEERMEINWTWGARNAVNDPLHDGAPRHTNSFNLVFTDGHAKNRKRDQRDSKFSGGTRDEEWLAQRNE